MRFVVLGAGVLLAGCVQQGYAPPPPIELQTYPPPIAYQTTPGYRAPIPAPLADPFPAPVPLPAPNASPGDDSGAIPIQQMPPPVPDTGSTVQTDPTAQTASPSPTPAAVRTPTAGPGSNVPLEGFRPMHSQSRPAP